MEKEPLLSVSLSPWEQIQPKNPLNWYSHQEYRSEIHNRMVMAEAKYNLRLKKVKGMNFQGQDLERLKYQELKCNADTRSLQEDYMTCDPAMPDSSKMKISKMSRTCMKSMIDRYCTLDRQHSQLIYYAHSDDQKPKNTVTLFDCRVTVESKSMIWEELKEEQKIVAWTEDDKPFRLCIRLKNRNYQPVYYYSESLHQAKVLKAQIEMILNHKEEVSSLIIYCTKVWEVIAKQRLYQKFLDLKTRNSRKKQMYRSISFLAKSFQLEKLDLTRFIGREIKRVKELEHQEQLRLKQLEEDKEKIEEIKEPDRIPEIYSTFQRGRVSISDVRWLRIYSKVSRLMKRLCLLSKERKAKRHPVIQDLISKKQAVSIFAAISGQYRVHDAILQNMVRKLSLVSLLFRINWEMFLIQYKMQMGQPMSELKVATLFSKIERVRKRVCDALEHELSLPVSEICFMAVDASNSQLKLQMRGRKINANVEMIGENILPSQLGLERTKASRLAQKQVLKISLKKIQVPLFIQDSIKSTMANKRDRVFFRLKFEVGEFYCYTSYFPAAVFSNIDLKEDLAVDINEAKHMKVSLVAIKGRQAPYNLYANEFVDEEVVAFASLRTRDFEEQASNEILHAIDFNGQFYNPKDAQIKVDSVALTAGLAVVQVDGAHPTAEMEGPQLLIGRYAIFNKKHIAKVLKVNRNMTAQIELIGPHINERLKNSVSVKNDLTLIERHGISVFNLSNLPQNYQNGQFEWSLDLVLGPNPQELVSRLVKASQHQQIQQMYTQRLFGFAKKSKNQSFVCGKIHLSVLSAQSLTNKDKGLCDSFVRVTVQETSKQSNARFLEIANEQSFVQCKKNSEEISNNNEIKTTVVKQNNNPQWVTQSNPHGETFDLGIFMKKYPHLILIEVCHQKKKSRFSAEMITEVIGFTELLTEELLNIDNYGQEHYLFLEDSITRSSLIKLRTLFVPSLGTIERLSLDPRKCVFKNAQQYLFYKVLHMHRVFDDYGYLVPLGKFLADHATQHTGVRQPLYDSNSSLIQDVALFQKRYEKFSPEHKKHQRLKEMNPDRPRIEENGYMFKQIWLYTQFMNRSKALNERQRAFWEEFMTDLMRTADEDGGFVDDELKSIRSKLTNTTKMISSKYRKRSRQLRNQSGIQQQQSNINEGSSVKSQDRGSKFSAVFVGQWEKEQSWKYVDIWYLIKFGIPQDLRVSLWKDLLRRQINEQQIYVYYRKHNEYGELYNANISNYDNLKVIAALNDSIFYQQIEADVKDFQFPEGYLRNQNSIREDRYEEERLSILNIMRAFATWTHEFSQRRHKIFIYNKGMISIVQRLLTFMTEEDAFWAVVGMAKAFNNFFVFDFKEPKDKIEVQFEHYNPIISRKVGLKNEMNILTCLIRLHFPQIYDHLKVLSMPLEFYFYDSLSTLFSNVFSSDIVLRLWDMVVFNLSTNTIENRKRALWYLLAVPLYMIQMNMDLVLKTQDPMRIKELLEKRTASLNYNPNVFIDELLNIIKQVFVKKDTLMNKVLKNDKAHQLENMRIEVEIEAVKRFKEQQLGAKQLAKFMYEREIVLELGKQLPSQKLSAEATFRFFAFRNLFLAQAEQDEVALQIHLQGQENRTSEIFKIQLPLNQSQSLCTYLIEPIAMRTQLVSESNKFTIKLVMIENELHQQELAKGAVVLDTFEGVFNKQVRMIKNKDFNAEEGYPCYVEIQGDIQTKQKQSNLLQFMDLTGTDLHNFQKDEDFKNSINQKDLDCYRTQNCPQNQSEFNINSALPGASQILQDADINLPLDQPLTAILMLIHGASQITVKDLLEKIITIFSRNSKISQDQLIQLVYHIYQAIYYPISLNDCMVLVSTLLSDTYPYIVKVTQEQTQESFLQDQIRPALSKLFTKQSMLAMPSVFDITHQFKQTLNQVIQTLPCIDYVDLSLPPFKNINFWLKGSNNLKKIEQIVTVNFALQRDGDIISYSYKVDKDTQEFIPLSQNRVKLPLDLNRDRLISKKDAVVLLQKLPLVSDVLRQNLFLAGQLQGSRELYIDFSFPVHVSFPCLNNTLFAFEFSQSIDKAEDFTVDPSQLMRIAKGDVTTIYLKEKLNDETLYRVKLSPLCVQDTFIQVKQRMKAVLDFIVQAENLKDTVPQVLSERFKFRRVSLIEDNINSERQFFSSLDRLTLARLTQVNNKMEVLRVQTGDNSDNDGWSYALYTHPTGQKEWRQCRIIMKAPQKGADQFIIEFKHEIGRQTHTYAREDLLLSHDYKRAQDDYYKEEIQEFLDKLDQEEALIAQALADQDRRGDGDMIRRQLDFGGEEGLKIGNAELDEEKDEELLEINNALEEDESKDMANLSSLLSGGI